MKLVVKRRELTEPGELQALVIDHVEGIEPGLVVLDSRLLLGQATIDAVALDARGSLVLLAAGAVADEEMLLRAVEAYSWCLEYPESIRRLYPMVQISAAQPPRLVFVIERMPDSFHRKIKQLGFPEVDCIEFRSLDIEGTAAVYFDALARLRRAAVAAAPAPEPPVIPPQAPAAGGRPTSVKLQKLLGGERPTPTREPAQVVSLLHRAPSRGEASKSSPMTAPAPRLEIATVCRLVDEPAGEPPTSDASMVTLEDGDPIALEVEPSEPSVALDEIAGDDAPDAATESLDSTEPLREDVDGDTGGADVEPEPTPAAIAAIVPDPGDVEPSIPTVASDEPGPPAGVMEPLAFAPEPLASAPVAVPDVTDSSAGVQPARIQAGGPSTSVFVRRASEPSATPDEPKVSFANVAKELLTSPAAADPPAAVVERPSAFSAFSKPNGLKRPRTIAPPPPDPQPITAPKLAAAPKRSTPETSPGMDAPPPPSVATAPEPAEPTVPQATDGLQFPNDGVLTRQWMEFLNQMAAGK